MSGSSWLCWFGMAALALAGDRDDVAALTHPASEATVTRAAWNRVTGQGPETLLTLLRSWPANDPVAANWCRTAFDDLTRRHAAQLPIEDLLTFASDPTGPGPARRLALRTVERQRPGTMRSLLASWLSDPEFGPDAVADRLRAAEELTDPQQRQQVLRNTFTATTQIEQAEAVAKLLTELGDTPDLLTHLGIVRQWYLVGPFPVTPEDGLKRSFPPETMTAIDSRFPGRTGPLAWSPARQETLDRRIDLIKLGIDPARGSVAYAQARITMTRPARATLCLSAVDNVTAWVNRQKVIERASTYRSMYRPDRYRAAVDLPAGESTILLKLTKTASEERGQGGPPARWEFQARWIDKHGHAVTFTQPEITK